MNKMFFILGLFVVFLSIAGCEPPQPPSDNRTQTEDDLLSSSTPVPDNLVVTTTKQNIQNYSANDFGLNLLRGLQNQNENIVISPLSVSTALALTYNGAEGQTKKAFEDTLLFETDKKESVNQAFQSKLQYLKSLDSEVVLKIANSIWFDGYDVHPNFIENGKQYFDAEIEEQITLKKVNNWVSQKTNGKIKSILQEIPALLKILIVNAVYFKGDWDKAFPENATEKRDFYLLGGSKNTHPLMKIEDEEFQYYEDDDWQMIRLDYKGRKLSMVVFLPQENKKLKSLLPTLDQQKWLEYLDKMQKKEGTIWLPKFKIAYGKKLNTVLGVLGLDVAFIPQANFSGMSTGGARDLFIGFVIHKTFIEVNEKGTEAAAVTAVGMIGNFMPMEADPPFYMEVNRPFLFAIIDNKNKEMLFLGSIYEPEL